MYICCSGLELCFSKGQESTSIQGYCVMLFGPKDPKSTSIDGIQYSPCTNDTLLFLSKRSRNAHLGSHGHPCCSLQEVCHSQLLPLWQRRFDVCVLPRPALHGSIWWKASCVSATMVVQAQMTCRLACYVTYLTLFESVWLDSVAAICGDIKRCAYINQYTVSSEVCF